MRRGEFEFGQPRTLQARMMALEGTHGHPPNHRWRRFLLSITRHQAKKSSGYATYEASGWDEWQRISGGQAFDRKQTRMGDITERFVLVDPSLECSWEEIARPSLRQQSIGDGEDSDGDVDRDIRGYGNGNVRFVTAGKYVSLLGADCRWTARAYDADRGAVSTYTIRVRIVTMLTSIVRGDTVEESEVKEIFASGVELDPILIHGWTWGMPEWAKLDKLDRWHKHWYRLFATGMILIGQVHHDASTFDVDVMEQHLLKLHNDIKNYIDEDAILTDITGEVYGRLELLSRMQPAIMRHVVELRRMTAFLMEPRPASSLPPIEEVWKKLSESYVPSPPVARSVPTKAPPIDEKAARIEKDLVYAKQLAKQEQLVSDEIATRKPRARAQTVQHFYEQIRSERPGLSWSSAWDLAQQQHAEANAIDDRHCKRTKRKY